MSEREGEKIEFNAPTDPRKFSCPGRKPVDPHSIQRGFPLIGFLRAPEKTCALCDARTPARPGGVRNFRVRREYFLPGPVRACHMVGGRTKSTRTHAEGETRRGK